MVEKEVKAPNQDPRYHTMRAVKKKFNPLFSNAKTIESKGLQMAKNCKKTVIKKEGRKLNITQFDAPREEY